MGASPKSCHGATGFNSSLRFDTPPRSCAHLTQVNIRGECEEKNSVCEDPQRRGYGSTRAMPLRRCACGDRFSRALGLARSLGGESAFSWRCLRYLCRQLAAPLPHHARKVGRHAIRRFGRGDDTQLLRSMRHADCLRTFPFTAYGECAAGSVQIAHRPAGSISHRDRRDAGVGLLGRAVVAP
jgi:hypothetical protein